jgi:hypothetical protein
MSYRLSKASQALFASKNQTVPQGHFYFNDNKCSKLESDYPVFYGEYIKK